MKERGWFLLLIACLFASLPLMGATCGGDDDDDDDDVSPYVEGASPEDGDDELKLATVVVISFSESMDQKSVENNFTISDVSGSYSWNEDGDEVTFTPSTILAEDEGYTAIISTGATDLAGNPLESTYQFSFRTVNLWTRTYDGPTHGSDIGFGIAVDGNGNVAGVGIQEPAKGGRDAWIRSYNKDGNERWTEVYDGTAGGDDRAYGVAVDDSGNIYMTGPESVAEQGWDINVRKYGSGGDLDWDFYHSGVDNDHDASYNVSVDTEGSFYVAGYETVPGQDKNIWVAKYDAARTEQWIDRYNGPADGDDRAYAVRVNGDGNVAVAGCETVAGEGMNAWIRKYDTTGTALWTRTHNGPSDQDDCGQGVAIDANGNVYVTGVEYVSGENLNIWTRKYNPDGSELWTKTHNGPANNYDGGHGVAVDSYGNVYVAGEHYTLDEEEDIWVTKYDANGNEVWTRTHNGPDDGRDIGLGIALDPNVNVYVIGCEVVAGEDYNVWIRKYDTDGNWAD